jgi:hypothetical protein
MGALDILDRPDTLKRLKVIFGVALAALVVADLLIHRGHAVFPWDDIPGFSAVYGLLSCAIIIMVSKYLGESGLMKPEDYYD